MLHRALRSSLAAVDPATLLVHLLNHYVASPQINSNSIPVVGPIRLQLNVERCGHPIWARLEPAGRLLPVSAASDGFVEFVVPSVEVHAGSGGPVRNQTIPDAMPTSEQVKGFMDRR